MGARILSGAVGTGAGPVIKSGAMNHGVLVSFTDVGAGSVSALLFKVQGRIAAGPWVDLVCVDTNAEATFSGGELTAKAAYRFFKEQPVDDIRVNITTLTQSGTNYVNADYKSEKN
jgi:hypothetical protein